jgi:hypothetical protein
MAGGKSSMPAICLRIARSRFVPNGIEANIIGIGDTLNYYVWKSNGSGDWQTTKRRLFELQTKLHATANVEDDPATLTVCDEILVWGGNRNRSVGAYRFLADMAETRTLCDYIKAAGESFALATADEGQLAPLSQR